MRIVRIKKNGDLVIPRGNYSLRHVNTSRVYYTDPYNPCEDCPFRYECRNKLINLIKRCF